MSRARKPRERRESAYAGAARHGTELEENVGADAKKKLGSSRKAKLPTEPHPYNTARYGPPRDFRGYPTITDYLRALLAENSKLKNTKTCPYQWWAWAKVRADLAKRIEVFAKFEETSPISQATINILSKALLALQQDLEDNRAPWC